MKKFKKCVIRGKIEPLSNVPYHSNAPFKRVSLLGKHSLPSANTHVAVHFINKIPKNLPEYSIPHKHNVDEINLIVSEKGKLTYEIHLDDEKYRVTSPATVFIPKGVLHKAKAISGRGMFVCMILSSHYKTYSG